MIAFILYVVFLVCLSLWVAKSGSADGFFVNARASGAGAVALSIVASSVGGSATIGMAGLAWEVGTPAFWWMASLAAGLLVLTLFLARTVRESGARTMPEILTTFIGAPSRPLAAVIIVVAWLAILAAQFTALAAILEPLFGHPEWGRLPLLLLGAALIVLYSIIGGQSAVIKSDCVQYVIMIVALLTALGYLLLNSTSGVHTQELLAAVPLELVNTELPTSRVTYFMCVLGGGAVVCPMLFGRLLSARNSSHAYWGGVLAVFGLLFTGVVVVALGLACRAVVPAGTQPEAVLTSAIMGAMPPWLGMLVLLGLFSAVISSADSCLVTAATVCCNDILHRTDLRTCRLITLAIGVGGFLLALPHKGILSLLLMANDIYVCGVVIPVFVGMVLHKRYSFHPLIMAAAIVVGGGLGLVAAALQQTSLSYTGMLSALFLSFCALRPRLPHSGAKASSAQGRSLVFGPESSVSTKNLFSRPSTPAKENI